MPIYHSLRPCRARRGGVVVAASCRHSGGLKMPDLCWRLCVAVLVVVVAMGSPWLLGPTTASTTVTGVSAASTTTTTTSTSSTSSEGEETPQQQQQRGRRRQRRLASATTTTTTTSSIASANTTITIPAAAAKTLVIPVFTPWLDTAVARKQRLDLQQQQQQAPPPSNHAPMIQLHVRASNRIEQRQHLEEFGGSCYQKKAQPNDSSSSTSSAAGAASLNPVLDRFDEFMNQPATTHFGIELWKYCVLYHELQQADTEFVAYIDPASPLLVSLSDVLQTIVLQKQQEQQEQQEMPVVPVNIAILGDSYFPRTIHASLLVLHASQQQQTVVARMIQSLVESPISTLRREPLYLPRLLYAVIHTEASSSTTSTAGTLDTVVAVAPDDVVHEHTAGVVMDPLEAGWNGNHWYLFENVCRIDPLRHMSTTDGSRNGGGVADNSNDDTIDNHGGGSSSDIRRRWTDTASYRVSYHCPDVNRYCCSAIWVEQRAVILMNPHPVLPVPTLSDASILPTPYNAVTGHFAEGELPFIATVTEVIHHRTALEIQNAPPTPNFFDVLLANDCLPDSDACSKCLHNKSGANCHSCLAVCPCYCKTLCHEPVDAKFVSKELQVLPPVYSRDPNRLIPRIVHQTWFEELTPDKYPNMSRFVESFKQSGWEYKFYSDEDAASFLSTHFPTEIRDAYDALRPGAFKADLFRYCVLLIHGGVYADVDILLESALDLAVPPDVGFMVPMDEPGTPANRRMCLWNGFIAAAPGHVVLATAIQTVVNQVRNRFTSVDVDATFCPNPEMSVLHAFDTLFTAGPCLLGASLNRVLGRHGQSQFEAGEIPTSSSSISSLDGTKTPIPGRTIILHQNKWDMGAHRFTLLDQNLVVAATDLPDSNDRDKKQEHYSKTHAKTGIYGLANLYTDARRANEDIHIRVVSEEFFAGNTAGFVF